MSDEYPPANPRDYLDQIDADLGFEFPEDEGLVCLDARGDADGCEGAVEYRYALSGTGRSFPRCDGHWAKRLDVQAGIDRRFPDSPFPPSDFDPGYAGERWNDDD